MLRCKIPWTYGWVDCSIEARQSKAAGLAHSLSRAVGLKSFSVTFFQKSNRFLAYSFPSAPQLKFPPKGYSFVS
jgi:hypothetical protein